MDYDDLKDSMNIKNEFCVYFEDENGNIVEGIKTIGSDKIEVNGKPCGE